MSSRPLLTSVAELIVTTGPMSQVGWASACSTVTSASSSAGAAAERAAAGGEHQPARPRSRAPPRRHCASAECSESTGTSCPGAAAASDQVAAGDQRLLVGQRDGAPGLQRGQRRAQADGAGDPVEDDVGGPGGQLLGGARAGQDLRQRVLALRPAALRGRRVEGQLQVLRGGGPGDGDRRTPRASACSASRPTSPPPAARPVIRSRSGFCRATSMACRPIEPVEPRTVTSRGALTGASSPTPRARRAVLPRAVLAGDGLPECRP